MVSIPKVAGVLLCGFLLCLGLSNTSQANEAGTAANDRMAGPCEVKPGLNALRAEQDEMQGTHMISGEVMRMEGANYFVKEQSGKEVSLQIDQRTEKPEINQGDRISAYVDDQNHALWI